MRPLIGTGPTLKCMAAVLYGSDNRCNDGARRTGGQAPVDKHRCDGDRWHIMVHPLSPIIIFLAHQTLITKSLLVFLLSRHCSSASWKDYNCKLYMLLMMMMMMMMLLLLLLPSLPAMTEASPRILPGLRWLGW